MDFDPPLDALVESLRADTSSGAAELAQAAADALATLAASAPAESADALRAALAEGARRVVAAQPAMASLVTLGGTVLDAVEGVASLEEARRAAGAAAAAFRGRIARARDDVAAQAASLLAGRRVATLSASSTVRAALLWSTTGPGGGTGVDGPASVICFESRPLREGRALAGALARAGLDVVLAVDAASCALVPGCDVALLGVDSIGDRGSVAKIGSVALARAARDAGVAVHLLADESKLLPLGFPQPLDDDRPAAEVWDAPRGVRVWNRYFEAVPDALVWSVVTERGVLAPDEVRARRSGLPAHAALWPTRGPTGHGAP